MKIFKTIDGTKVNDIVEYTLEMLKKNPEIEIHIGADSQNKRKQSTYTIVIAYKLGTRGVHYIYHKTEIPKITDRFTRLWKEAELTIETAENLRQQLKSLIIELDFDYNHDKKYFSSKLIEAASGWATSLGYRANTKQQVLVATRAADYHCK